MSSCILVVEDEELIRFMAESMLQRLGYEVVLASDAQEAMVMLSDDALKHCNVMLADINMPGKSGIELSKMAKELKPGMKIFLMSGGGQKKSEVSSYCDDYMDKPFHMERLNEMLSSNNVSP